MLTTLLQFARSQSAEELRRQSLLCSRIEIQRRLLATVPFMVGGLFMSPWLCAVLAVVDMGLEIAGLRMLNATDPAKSPLRYLTMLAIFFAANVTYVVVPALAWQVDDPFSKAFAIGAILVNVVHVATVRTVHLPLAMSDYTAAGLVTVLGNTVYWLNRGDLTGLAVSSICLGCALHFSFITMRSVHDVHAETYQERQLAEAANAAKTRFLAQMSHELRTPLNAILGMGYAEMTFSTTPEAKERLTTMVDSARSLSMMLDDILDLSAIEAGRLLIRPKVVDLRAEIERTLALFHQQLAESRLELLVDLPANLPTHVLIDGQRFRQCLANVVSNAIKYTRAGMIRVEVSTFPPNLLGMDIWDSGPGVPSDLREQIFEPFLRADSTVAGTGLGLSISRTLARRMGGDLNLMPSKCGARFRLTIAIPRALAHDLPPPPSLPVDLGQSRVLVVDDVATNRLVAMTYLRLMGARPEEVSSGPEALTLIEADPPDVVLLDVLMDGMDGMETFRRIRALPGPAGRTPIIAVTADATDERRKACLAAGFDGYITKPISPELLGSALHSIIAAARG
jgi:signal transduction histidine kinase